MPNPPYILTPEWEWPIVLALFIAGVASGAYAAMGLIHFAGDRSTTVVGFACRVSTRSPTASCCSVSASCCRSS